jgi:ABC-type bacteriocin/lantibiotic exporter with double-glycine peptidase domain
MPMPQILRAEVLRPFPPPHAASAGELDTVNILTAAGAGTTAFAIQDQEQSNWCWSAVAVSVSRYYRSALWTQCGLAEAVLERVGCCLDKASCNQEAALSDALRRTRNLAQGPVAPLDFFDLTAEIDAGRPVCFRVEFNDIKGHFVVVSAYAGDRVTVQDPVGSVTTTLLYEEFKTRYQSSGRCTHSFLTEEAS